MKNAMGKVKFTVFSDLHHHPAWYKTEAPERLAAIQKRALDSGSEFLLHLGDFTHKPSAAPELIRQYLDFSSSVQSLNCVLLFATP